MKEVFSKNSHRDLELRTWKVDFAGDIIKPNIYVKLY